MRADLLKQIGELRDVTNAVLLTHNVDFVFLQSVVMSYLRRCGNPKLTVLADAACANASYQSQRELLDGLGSRYRTVPIRMQPGFVFHPKALLLAGPERAVLYVGSGNLTFGGFRHNGEVWARFTTEDDGLAPFDAFRRYVRGSLSRVPLRETIEAEIEDAFDSSSKKWMTNSQAGSSVLVGRSGGEPPLLDRVVELLGTERADEMIVCSPYFDDGGDALSMLRTRIPHDRGLVIHPGRGSSLSASAWEHSGRGMTRRPVRILHQQDEGRRPGFVHSKFYAVVRGDSATIVQGSANCSRAALLMDGPRGNAELMAVVRTTAETFRRDWLEVLSDSPDTDLNNNVQMDEDIEPSESWLEVTAARADQGVILAAYQPSTAYVERCMVDKHEVSFSVLSPGQLCIPYFARGESLVIVAAIKELLVTSDPHWIDQESELQSTAYRRRLEDAVPRTMGGDSWTADQWIELLQILGEHLKFTPIRSTLNVRRDRAKDPAAELRSFDDLFSSDTESAVVRDRGDESASVEGHHSVRQLLLRWLGVRDDSSELIENSPTDPDERTDGAGEGNEGGAPRRPRVTTVKSADMSARAAEKLRRILADIKISVTAAAYLESRPAELLQSDLKMMSAILQFGHARGWLSDQAFFSFTQTAWTSLFLAGPDDFDLSWIEWRQKSAPDPELFLAALTSAELSAALALWSTIGADATKSRERAGFLLARALSAAHMPQLWIGGDVDDIVHEVSEFLAASGRHIDTQRFTAAWRETLSQGQALRRLESWLDELGIDEVRQRLETVGVVDGDLLWQGSAGYCVTLVSGSASDYIPTLHMRSGSEKKFLGRMLVPLRGLLSRADVIATVGTAGVAAISALQSEIAANVAAGHAIS